MDMLKLAIAARLPLIHITTDDVINLEDVLSYVAGKRVKAVNIPEKIGKVEELKLPDEHDNLFMTPVDCQSLPKLYRFAVDREVTFVFVNTRRDVLQFDGGPLYPPQDMVAEFLRGVIEDDDDAVAALLPCFGGLTLKDVSEVAKLTMTRDESLTPQGVNETRRGYAGNLRGIEQIDSEQAFYVPPSSVTKWVKANSKFFLNPPHPSLIPRGLLFDGPPGTGKTEGSKYIARAFNVPLYRLDLGALMGKYVGESEGNLLAALTQIDQVQPCVILLDEVEKIFSGGHDSGVSSRLLSQLLWWLQEHKSKVFTIMTTNDKDAIPKELWRPGRIDSAMFFGGIPSAKEGREFAVKAIQALAVEIQYTLTTADMKALDKRVAMAFADNNPVPQAHVMQTVFTALKEFSTEEGDAE
jgi:hypothetical protein